MNGQGQGNGAHGNGSQGNSNANGSGVPQANVTGASTVHGTVVSFDQMGLSLTLDDGTGQVSSFRSETGQPLWAGGNGKGNGGNH
jgi:hypothetical protein